MLCGLSSAPTRKSTAPTIPMKRIARIASGRRSALFKGIVLLLIHQGSSFGNASLDQFGLNLELLVGPQIDHSFKGQVSRQRYSNIVAARCEQHGFSRAIELADISCKLIIHK